MYLDKNLVLSEVQTGIVCHMDEDYSSGEIVVYRCYNSENELCYQVSGGFYPTEDLKNSSQYAGYLKPAENGKQYLVGHYANEKPMNGFFKPEGDDLDIDEWNIFDFYENGIRTEQVYNNLFKTLLGGWDDNKYTWYSLNGRSVYKDGLLVSGCRVLQVKDSGAGIQLAENVEDGKTVDYSIGLFAMHYGEIISIKPISNCYQLKSFGNNQVLNICYQENGRSIEFIDNESGEKFEFSFYNQKLSDFKLSDLKEGEKAKYFRQNNEVYVERQHNPFVEINEKWREKFNDEVLVRLSYIFSVKNQTLTFDRILNMFKNQFDKSNSDLLSSIMLIKGRHYGYKWKTGKTSGTYTVTSLYGEDEEFIAENKTIDEILPMLFALYPKDEEEVFYEF